LAAVRVLITGGAGFIGSHVVAAYHRAGHEVRVLDALLPAVHPAYPGGVPGLEGVDLVVGDVRDRETVDRALDGVDAVCHQAAMVGLGVDVQDMPDYAGINGLGTAVLLAAMARGRPVGTGLLDGGLRRGPLRVPRARRRPRRAAPPG
jgi:dTDP-L-rhamnose 4-epimerase